MAKESSALSARAGIAAAQDCIKLGYDKDCTGTEESGNGETCNGKYQSCNCASGYEWNGSACQEILNGAQGDLFYCNGTVVGVKASDMNFYVAMQDLGQMAWEVAKYQCTNYVFCNNLTGNLPNTEQLVNIYDNKTLINNMLSSHGGVPITESYYWSSVFENINYEIVLMSYGYVHVTSKNSYDIYTRPILTSW